MASCHTASIDIQSPTPPRPVILPCMPAAPTFLTLARRQGASLVARTVSRDDLHLVPPALTRAAAGRLRQGLRAIEAYVRRVLVLLALSLEAGLNADQTPRAIYGRLQQPAVAKLGFRIFQNASVRADFSALSPKKRSECLPGEKIIPAAPLLARLAQLQALITAPEARARRLAFHMARARPGPVLPPGFGRIGVPRHYGPEVSALYASLASAILTASRARPPPLGPAPRAPPRIRCL